MLGNRFGDNPAMASAAILLASPGGHDSAFGTALMQILELITGKTLCVLQFNPFRAFRSFGGSKVFVLIRANSCHPSQMDDKSKRRLEKRLATQPTRA